MKNSGTSCSKKRTQAVINKDIDSIIEEDPLIQSLIECEGKEIEVIAFGISYTGILKMIDVENGFITVADNEDTAILELERISSFRRIG